MWKHKIKNRTKYLLLGTISSSLSMFCGFKFCWTQVKSAALQPKGVWRWTSWLNPLSRSADPTPQLFSIHRMPTFFCQCFSDCTPVYPVFCIRALPLSILPDDSSDVDWKGCNMSGIAQRCLTSSPLVISAWWVQSLECEVRECCVVSALYALY